MRDRFYDPHLNGLDWQEERARFRPQAASATSAEDVAAAINRCWRTRRLPHPFLHAGRAGLLPACRYFRGRARASRSGAGVSRRGVSYPGIGVFSAPTNRAALRHRGDRGRARAPGRILLGDEIVSADDRAFRPVGSFRGKVGIAGLARIRRASGAAPCDQRIAGRSSTERDVPGRPEGQRPDDRHGQGRGSDTCMSGPMPAADISPRWRT